MPYVSMRDGTHDEVGGRVRPTEIGGRVWPGEVDAIADTCCFGIAAHSLDEGAVTLERTDDRQSP